MDSICCVADAQGYSVNGKFIICELSFYNGEMNLHQAFNPSIAWNEISPKEYRTLQFVRDNIHGLDLHPMRCLPSSKQAEEFIMKFYKKIYEEGKFIGTNNSQLEQEFKRLGIPYKRLIDAPKLFVLDSQKGNWPWTCMYHLHTNSPSPRCTVRKCMRLWKWLSENK